MTQNASSLLSALAAFVIRQSAAVQQDGGIISGVDRIPGGTTGLTPEDRHAMARISRHLLLRGRADAAAEVHQLLSRCSDPLGDWLDHPDVNEGGLQGVRLIDSQSWVPTLEARQLARDFQGFLPDEEEVLFSGFKGVCKGKYGNRAAYAYTAVREWVIRHPITRTEDIQQFLVGGKLIGPLISNVLQFYDPVPLGWSLKEGVPQCLRCGNAMERLANKTLRCRTPACAETSNPIVKGHVEPDNLLRIKRAMMVYWVNPGFDEILLYDRLKAAGQAVELYPQMDLVDLAIGNTGMDLKSYRSPELLAARFNQGIGGLAQYTRRIVVIPDRLLIAAPGYMQRLTQALQGPAAALECRTVSQILQEFGHA